ncbi:ImmA/IrrE family metallo-endopeptidase [uncultured Kordia sp.]|uniref:ImmA/IrrE family metallo-endopeptidase n=1 Tax=uncultured Kordia sp. TaxID=507699 RepID=UPI00261789DA|nr:ImmA/IrrE family metallo-endopeptidase [uncultured Kordia sp.]
MKAIFLDAIKSSTRVRDRLGLNMFEPVNIYDVCEQEGITVRIVNINMEGIYVKSDKFNKPTILLSNERPIPRRIFTCAHEYGHHFFGHGSKIDSLNYSNQYTSDQDQEELLVNVFAGSLLMPIAGIQAEFAKRKLNPNTASPLEYYLISSFFGVGYHTLIYQCRANRITNNSTTKTLLKYIPSKIFKENFSRELKSSHFKYFDNHSQPTYVDLEVSNYIVLPSNASVDKSFLKPIRITGLGIVYSAIKSGISEVRSENFKRNMTIRIESQNYIGLSEYRHLE